MPTLYTSLIGKEVRRITFSLHKDGKYYLVYSVIEELLPDMQDFNMDYSRLFHTAENGFVVERASSSPKSGREGKIYFSIDRFTVTREFLDNPMENYILNDGCGTMVICDGKYIRTSQWIEDKSGVPDMLKCFPRRQDSRSVTVWTDQSRAMQSAIMDHETLRQQYARVSTDCYGVDLSLFPEFIGNINIIRYNPYFRRIDWSISTEPPGIYATLSQRKDSGILNVEFINKTRQGQFEYCVSRKLDLSARYHFFELPDTPDSLTVLIKDASGNLIYAASDMVFIRSFSLRTQIINKSVTVHHRDGSSDTVNKYGSHITDNISAGTPRQNDVTLSSPTQAFRLLEESLDFAFFNGSKDRTENELNRNRAKAFVKKIIARASRRCYIADPYFNLDDLSRFVFTMPQSDVTVRIISAMEFLASKYTDKKTAVTHKQEAKDISTNLKAYTDKVGGNIRFRLLKGTCPLHDRYIVADDSVWLMGTSFNEIGKRACTIIKLPKASCRAIINMLESWWTDSSLTVSVEEYADNHR